MNKVATLVILAVMSSPLACYADAIDTATSNMNAVGHDVASSAADTAITTQVKAALAAEPGISSLKIHVKTVNKVVHLQGDVMNDEQMHKVVDIAKKVNDVKSVDSSELKVVKH